MAWGRSRTVCSWRAPSRQATEQQSRVAHRIDPQPDAAPFDRIAFAGDKFVAARDLAAFTAGIDLGVAERQPEFVHVARQRDRHRYRIGMVDGLLHKTDHVTVLDAEKAQIAGLLQRCIGTADVVEIADIRLDITRLFPIPALDLVFFRVSATFY